MSRCDNWKGNSDQTRRDWKESQDEKCVEWADEGSEKCSEWADEGSEKCKAWERCKWYTPWNCIAGFFCKAYYWVSKWVCKAYYWVSKWVCKACGTVGNFGWWVGSRIGWIACVVYDAVIKPVVDWILEAFGVCTTRRKVSGVTRLTPASPSDLPDGVGSFNNVSYAAPVEALRYSAEKIIIGRFNDEGKNDPNGQWPVYNYPYHDQLYKPGAFKSTSLSYRCLFRRSEKGVN